MATRGRKSRKGRRSALRRQTRNLLLAGAVVFLFLSLVSWAPAGARGGNLCGAAGRVVAEPILAWLGFSSFGLFGLLVFWAVSRLFGRRLVHPALKATGIVLFTLSSAALLATLMDQVPYRAGGLYGPGGLAGASLANRLLYVSGAVGTFLLTTVGILTGLSLATDLLVVEIGKDLAAAAKAVRARIAEALPQLPGRRLATAGAGATAVLDEPEVGSPAGGTAAAEEPAPEPEPEPEPVRKEPAAERSATERAPKPRPKRKPGRRTTKTGEGEYVFPSTDLLDPVKNRDPRAQEAMIRENADILEETLRQFKVEADVVEYCRGPVVTLYELSLGVGVKVNRIHNLSEDLAVALKAPAVRVVAPLPGRSTIGVEVPNPVRDDVRLRELATADQLDRSPALLPLFLGTDVAGAPLIEDLTTMPHLLIAGATGSGKSVAINAVLVSLLMTRTPEQVRMILIDPKQVELTFFSRVPHLMTPVVHEMKKAVSVLEWLVDQMEERYALLHAMEVRNIRSYNELGPKKIAERKKDLGIEEEEGEESEFPDRLPYVVVVVDELAEMMMTAGKEVETLITRLAQKSRAVGIHIILATQRPSTDVITGLIKANMPSRISFQVASKIDSRVVLDQNGADKLLGRGDMLFLPPGTSHLVRSQGTFVSDGEVKRIVKFLSARGEQEFDESLTNAQAGQLLADEDRDPLYEEAVEVILGEQRGSASLLQRALQVGYTRGSRLMDQMHKEGLVGPYKGSKARDVLMTLEEYQERVRSRRESA